MAWCGEHHARQTDTAWSAQHDEFAAAVSTAALRPRGVGIIVGQCRRGATRARRHHGGKCWHGSLFAYRCGLQTNGDVSLRLRQALKLHAAQGKRLRVQQLGHQQSLAAAEGDVFADIAHHDLMGAIRLRQSFDDPSPPIRRLSLRKSGLSGKCLDDTKRSHRRAVGSCNHELIPALAVTHGKMSCPPLFT